MAKKYIGVRLEEDIAARIGAFAEENCGGNRTEAIETLIARGLQYETTEDALEKKLSDFMDTQFERLAKLTSRGTKASLANLFFLATYLPALSDENIALKKMLMDYAQAQGLLLDDEAFADATISVDKFADVLPSQLFDYMFAAGGKLQGEKGTPSYLYAERGLHLYEKREEE